jgi:hypothetical protein
MKRVMNKQDYDKMFPQYSYPTKKEKNVDWLSRKTGKPKEYWNKCTSKSLQAIIIKENK